VPWLSAIIQAFPRDDMPRIRRAEQQQAVTLLGVKEFDFFGLI